MQEPERAQAVVAAVRRGTNRPLSVKVRLGERLDEVALVKFCRMLEDEGVNLLTVHARLRREPYGRTPRWTWIAKVKAAVGIPVVANGGIFSAADAARCRTESGCDGLMLGRGAVVRPWLFAEIAAQLAGAPPPSQPPSRPELFRRFTQYLQESLAPERRLSRLKEFTHYFSQTYPFSHTLASAVQNSPTVQHAAQQAEQFFRVNEPGAPPVSSSGGCV